MQAWYFTKNNESIGPVSEDTIKHLLTSGELTLDVRVWREGLDSWVPARTLSELNTSKRTVPPPIPPIRQQLVDICAFAQRRFVVVAGIVVVAGVSSIFFLNGHESAGDASQVSQYESSGDSHTVMKPISSLADTNTYAGISQSEAERRRLEEETHLAALRAEQERIERIREDERREREERETKIRHESLVRQFADSTGQQIMDQVGGGRDLIVSVRDWTFDKFEKRFDANVSISFTGAVFRSNSYEVGGRLRVGEDGSNPEFARNYANDKFKKAERNLNWAKVGAASVLVLEAMKANE